MSNLPSFRVPSDQSKVIREHNVCIIFYDEDESVKDLKVNSLVVLTDGEYLYTAVVADIKIKNIAGVAGLYSQHHVQYALFSVYSTSLVR